jgi:hypothetical protein
MKFKIFLTLLLASSYIFSQDRSHAECPVGVILNNSEYCIKRLDENKIHFNSECLEYAETGMKLNLDGFNEIVLSVIHFDSEGPFIFSVNGDRMSGKTQVWCENCGFYHDPPPHPKGFPKPF